MYYDDDDYDEIWCTYGDNRIKFHKRNCQYYRFDGICINNRYYRYMCKCQLKCTCHCDYFKPKAKKTRVPKSLPCTNGSPYYYNPDKISAYVKHLKTLQLTINSKFHHNKYGECTIKNIEKHSKIIERPHYNKKILFSLNSYVITIDNGKKLYISMETFNLFTPLPES